MYEMRFKKNNLLGPVELWKKENQQLFRLLAHAYISSHVSPIDKALVLFHCYPFSFPRAEGMFICHMF